MPLPRVLKMENRVSKGLETAANVAIILAAILLSVVLIKNYLLPGTPVDALSSGNAVVDLQGKTVALDGVEWVASEQTLVLGLSTTCHFCTESMPFYKQLIDGHANVKTIAVFSQPLEDAKKYLQLHGVSVTDVRSANFETLGIDGTPTILLVDREGKVIKSWRGKLDAVTETEVLDLL